MDKNTLIILLTFSLLSFLLPSSFAEIKHLQIKTNSHSIIFFEKFSFTHFGHVTVTLTNVSVSVTSSLSRLDPSRLGFFLLSEQSLTQVLLEMEQIPNLCVLDSSYTTILFTFRDLSPPPQTFFNHSYPITTPNKYSLFFANCAPKNQVTMAVRTEIYNLDNGVKDYLPAGQTHLSTLYFFFSISYFVFLGFWIFICYKNQLSLHRIHFLMAGLLMMKALNLICAAEDYHYVKITGIPHGWDVLFYIFQFIRIVWLFTVIALIGTGWSFLKPFLQEKEKKVLMIVIQLQVIVNVAPVVIGETWNLLFLLVDIACVFVISSQIVWSIKLLRETSKTDGKAARNLEKLKLFRQFYMFVIGYLYFMRIVGFALRKIVTYKYEWMSNGAEEIVSLGFYLLIFYMFRPVERNEYSVLDEEEEVALLSEGLEI